MSEPSSWPLSQSALRVTVADSLINALSQHVLTKDCYTTAIGFYPHATSHAMKRTEHDDYILIYCTEGRGTLTLSGTEYVVKMGDVFILPPNSEHAYQADNASPWTVYWCHFQGKHASDFYHYLYENQTGPIIHNITDIDFIQAFRELVDMVRVSEQLEDFIHASNFFRQLLSSIERQSKQSVDKEMGFPIHRVQHFMRMNMDKSLSLAELASLSHCSKYHFARLYQHYTGKSPLKHFTEFKMEHACFLLEQTSLSMSEIGAHLGYDDALYFSRVFRRVIGKAPSHFRKSLIDNS